MKSVLASYPDKDDLVTEVYYDDELWAAVSREGAEQVVEVYPPIGSEAWRFPLEEAIAALQEASRRLDGNGRDHLASARAAMLAAGVPGSVRRP